MKKIYSWCLSALLLGCLQLVSCSKTTSGGSGGGNNSTGGPGGSAAGTPGNVITFAGNGAQGYMDATGSAAQFGSPVAIAIDNQDNLYVVDGLNYAIRKITPAGVVSTLAGDGTSGFVNAQGTKARFEAPNGITVDKNQNVFVSEGNSHNNHRIRKIAPDGTVTTYAGAGVSGYLDGTASMAKFNVPAAMALDAESNLYIGDVNNERIRKILGSPILTLVSTFAGNGNQGYANGTGASAEFALPSGLAFDPSGNLYVADEYNYCIRKITPSGTVSEFAGDPNNAGVGNGKGNAAQFDNPVAVAIDASGNIYVAEGSINNCIRKIAPDGTVTSLTGTQNGGYADGPFAKAAFNNPSGLAVDSKGNIYVADAWNYRIRKIIIN
jgi:serine/threonine protein kinase, bacterial